MREGKMYIFSIILLSTLKNFITLIIIIILIGVEEFKNKNKLGFYESTKSNNHN